VNARFQELTHREIWQSHGIFLFRLTSARRVTGMSRHRKDERLCGNQRLHAANPNPACGFKQASLYGNRTGIARPGLHKSTFPDIFPEMNPPKTALIRYRKRIASRNLHRVEVLATKSDAELLRALARKLTDDSPQAEGLRATLQRETEPPKSAAKGGLLRALLSSPLTGADLEFPREPHPGRKIDL
jgi:hypothetical protein